MKDGQHKKGITTEFVTMPKVEFERMLEQGVHQLNTVTKALDITMFSMQMVDRSAHKDADEINRLHLKVQELETYRKLYGPIDQA